MALEMKTAPAPPPPAPPAAGGKSAPPNTLTRAVKPLILLMAPAALYFAIYWAPQSWEYWILLTCMVLTGAVLAWTAWRVIRFLRVEVFRRRQKAFQRRRDPVFLAGKQIESRVRLVVERQENAGLGPYGLPWYLVMAESPAEVENLLNNSGLTFPHGMDQGLNQEEDQPDHWRLASEAVFLDTSALSSDRRDHGRWGLVAEALARVRPAEPINGAIVLVGLDELAQPDDEPGKDRWLSALERLRSLQDKLSLNFPVYVVVTGMRRLPGFNEFFAHLTSEQREQMMGWSDPRGPEQDFEQKQFREGLAGILNGVRGIMYLRLSADLAPDPAGRIYCFSDEIKGALEGLRRTVETLFTRNRYLDPLPLRGAYLTGAGPERPLVAFGPGGKLVPAGTGAFDSLGGEEAFFTKDLFRSKILLETGLTSRPRRAIRREWIIRGVTAFLLAASLTLGGWWVYDTAREASQITQSSASTLEAARTALAGGASAYDPLDLAVRLSDLADRLDGASWWQEVLGLWRYKGLARQVGEVHRAVFQELFLRYYLGQVKTALQMWSGKGDFQSFAGALVEYVRWSNPNLGPGAHLAITPFVRFMGGGPDAQQLVAGQFDRYVQEGGPKGNLVGEGNEVMIQETLDKLSSYLNPSLPGAPGSQSVGEESSWWLAFTRGLEGLHQSYRSLVNRRPPDKDAPIEEITAGYDNILDSLTVFLNGVDAQAALMAQAAAQSASWVDADDVFRNLSEAARGWDPVIRRISSDREVSRLYSRRVTEPLNQHLYLVQLLSDQEGFGWLARVVGSAMGDRADLVLDPANQVGPFILSILRSLKDYHKEIENSSGRLESWKSQLGRFTDLSPVAQELRSTEQAILTAEDRVEGNLNEMERLSGANQKTAAPGQDPAGGAGKGAAASGASLTKAVDQTKSLMSKLGMGGGSGGAALGEILGLYQWDLMDARVKNWLLVFQRMRTAVAVEYWQELPLRFSFGEDLVPGNDWQSIKAASVFQLDDAESLVSPLSQFLRDWQRELPQDLLSLSQGKNPVHRELRDFTEINGQLATLESRYLPSLRKAVSQMVQAVHDMPLDPAAAWRLIKSSAGPGGGGGGSTVFWGALTAISDFKTSYETQEGPAMGQIMEPLAELESRVDSAFSQAVVASFQSRWKALMSQYGKQGFPRKFPFDPAGEESVGHDQLAAFLSGLDDLAADYGLLPPAPPAGGGAAAAAAAAVTPTLTTLQASRIAGQLTSGGRLDFVKKAAALGDFLDGRNLKEPRSVDVSIVPGAIGQYVHWVRLLFGDGTYVDLNVYGKPTEKIQLRDGLGSVTLEGLDLNRNPLTSLEVSRGDNALLQMAYAQGGTRDPERRRWKVGGALPSWDDPGRMIPLDMQMTFSQGLPELPRWPRE